MLSVCETLLLGLNVFVFVPPFFCSSPHLNDIHFSLSKPQYSQCGSFLPL
eukprot:m.440 g.440  ORF g.440 m.440 type:complete len:50 (+) comp368_c0_seq1:1-150(+)